MTLKKEKGITLKGHLSAVYTIDYSPDGTRIVSGSRDRTIKIWDAINEGPPIMTLDNHTNYVYSTKYNYDGTRLVSGARDDTIKMWNTLDGGQLIYTIQLDADVRSVDFNHDGSHIVSLSRNLVQVWDAEKGSPIMTLNEHTEPIRMVTYSPDGTLIASASEDNTIKIWDATNEGPAKLTLEGHLGDVTSIDFNPSGDRLVSCSSDSTIKTWDPINGGKAIKTIDGHTNDIYSVVYNNDGSMIASGGWDNNLNIWDARMGGNPILTFDGSDIGDVDEIVFSPVDGQMAFASNEEIEVWRIISETRSPSTPPTEATEAPVKDYTPSKSPVVAQPSPVAPTQVIPDGRPTMQAGSSIIEKSADMGGGEVVGIIIGSLIAAFAGAMLVRFVFQRNRGRVSEFEQQNSVML